MCIKFKNRNVGAGIFIKRHQQYNGSPKNTNVQATKGRKISCQEPGMC